MACAPAAAVKSAISTRSGCEAELGHASAPDGAAVGAVEHVGRPGDVGDARVAELGEVARRRRDARPVVLADRRERARDVGAVERDRLQAELPQQRDARVVEAQVGEEDAVDALAAREVAVAVGSCSRSSPTTCSSSAWLAGGELELDAGDERGEERVGASSERIAGDHEAERVLVAPAERTRRGARLPAELVGHREDAVARSSSATPGRPLSANDTAAVDTPAWRATSTIVGPRRRALARSSPTLTGLMSRAVWA